MLGKMLFKGTWRDYQARVLAEMDRHLADGRLHIVAAPGSGKTVLGLEAMRQIGRPALILSPSITIRDQWRERLFPWFLDDRHGWDAHISSDIETPATMTIATYQALHAIYAMGEDRFDALIVALERQGPLTLIVDEAHHLRREWWSALFALRDRLKGTVLIALTATPPYDAPLSEWNRYAALCGPIDSEISVPELVRNGDLCPHQDHVHFSVPNQDELTILLERRAAITALVAGLLGDAELVACLAAHPWLVEPEAHEAELFERPDHLTALMIFLQAAGHAIPRAATRLLGVGDAELPPLSAAWLERLFDGLLNEPRSKVQLGDARCAELRRVLNTLGAVQNGRVTLDESKPVFTAMAGSVAKLGSIAAIVRAEAVAMGDGLRLVILSDRVRADELPPRADASFVPAKLGVAPIFETLRRAGLVENGLAVLTGTLVILPIAADIALEAEATAARIDLARIRRRALPGCPGHVALEFGGGETQPAVLLVTRLFQRGVIRVLIGTQALLGEGWDAPAINSLILASNAGSYMLSNQMRGRAIRIDPDQPGKVAAIWHLATVAPRGSGQNFSEESDMIALVRRFDAFEGISNGEGRMIENGIGRLGLDALDGPDQRNAASFASARDRARVADKWRVSLGDATSRSHVRCVAEARYAPRQLAWADTLQALILSGISGGALSAAGVVRQFAHLGGAATLAMLFFGATFVYALPKLALAARLWRRNGTLERSLAQVGRALCASLCHAGALGRDETDYEILVRRSLSGHCEVIIDGATRAEERVFLDALAELLGPIQNPRYLLVRRSALWGRSRMDYHAVPASLGVRKELAEHFLGEWRRRVGSSRLLFARTQEGRRALLRARVQSFAGGMQRAFQRRSVWM
ncbi:superfamily II DNA or RNA helicase [Sphingomonas leidyi]|uniref:Superfamily II DNA or RNA helicase n=2 Tax=Sphingomonas leidyi TaxID=68569 RepID=A0A7X5V1D1_9SPHN|nr:superfamily II DNA or RNA helicase [Sphingomonas leidyi]